MFEWGSYGSFPISLKRLLIFSSLLPCFFYFCGMKWIGERISFVEDRLKSSFVIYPGTKAVIKSLMGAWFAMWLVIGSTMIWVFSTFVLRDQEFLIVVIFLVFWLYYAVKVGRSFFWIMWGKELIKVNEAALIYKRSVKNYGRATAYYLENISRIRVFQPKDNSLQAVWEDSPWVRGGERIEFDYLGKTIRLGRKLNEKDAKLFFSLLSKKVEERLRKVKH
jgi:hypothetical protein